MKATELRIGNLVIDEDGLIKPINAITNAFVFHEEDLFSSLISLNPIPITEKWLVKFGFKHVVNYFTMENTLLRITELNGFHCSLGDNDCGVLFKMIKYVHELQNLYFALTGEELIIKG